MTTADQRIPGYEILDVLGEGGMGIVSRARNVATGRLVAIKHLHGRLSGDADEQTRFRREAALCLEIQHPGLVRLLDFQLDGEAPYLVFDLVEGETLAAIIAREGSLPATRALDLIAQLAEALAVLHKAGIVHRDLKPANVIVRPGDQVCLLDFGVAKHFGDAVRTMDNLTREGLILGTLPYIPPDAFGSQPSPTHDVWSLGVLLFELLVGERPFGGKEFDGVVAFLDRLRAGNFPAPSSRIPSVPVVVDVATAELLALDPGNRPADGAVASALLRQTQRKLVSNDTTVTKSRRLRAVGSQAKGTPARQAARLPSHTPRRQLVGAWCLGAVVLLVGAMMMGLRLRDPIPAPSPSVSQAASSPTTETGKDDRRADMLAAVLERARPSLSAEWLTGFALKHRPIIDSVPKTVGVALAGHLEQVGVLTPLRQFLESHREAKQGGPARPISSRLRSALSELLVIQYFCEEHSVPVPWGDVDLDARTTDDDYAIDPWTLDLKTALTWNRCASKPENRYFPSREWTERWTLPAPADTDRVLVWFALLRWHNGLVLDVEVNKSLRRVFRFRVPKRALPVVPVHAVEFELFGNIQRNVALDVLTGSKRDGHRGYVGRWIPRSALRPVTEIRVHMIDLPLSKVSSLADPELANRLITYVPAPGTTGGQPSGQR